MNTSLKDRQISVFTKILQAFLIFILPLYFFNMQINLWGQEDVKKEIDESVKSKIEFYLTALEKDFIFVMEYQNNLINDQTIENASATPDDQVGDFTRLSSLPEIKPKLRRLIEVSSYISNALTYIPGRKIKVTPGSFEENVSKEELDAFSSFVKDNKYPFVRWNGRIYINRAPYIAPGAAGTPKYIISVELAEARIMEVLDQISGNLQGGAMLIGSTEYGLNIASRSDKAMMPHFKAFLDDAKAKNMVDYLNTINIGNKKYYAYHKESQLLGSSLLVYIPQKQFLSSLTRYRTWLWVISAITVVVVILFALWMQRIIVKPLNRLTVAFKKVEEGDLSVSLEYNRNDEFGFLYRQFNEMCRRLGLLIEQVYEEKLRAKNSELKQLQYQINPHFLYNSLFIIYRMANMHDHEGVVRLTQHLGNYYQFVTRGSSDEVPLQREVNHAKDYIEIQSIRFSNRIKAFVGDLPEGCSNISVPRLILQPLIENCYNHGLKDKLKDGLINVTFQKDGRYLKFFVEDNGVGLDTEKLNDMQRVLASTDHNVESTGILNVHRRLQIRYGTDAGLYVSNGEAGGFKVEMRIVIEEGEKHVQLADNR